MRYVLAILALAISGVLLLLGIGQRTFLAGPTEIVYPITSTEGAAYATIDGSEFSKVPGQANIVLRGADAFVAVAKTRDIEGWVAPFSHEQLTIDVTSKAIEHTAVTPEKQAEDLLDVDDEGFALPLDPRGSDLWLESGSSEDGALRLPVAPTEKQSILISGDGEGPIPSGTSLVWVQDNATPWAGPLFLAGGAFAFLGALLYLIAFDRDKRALGPRRGRRGPLLGVQNVVKGTRLRRTKPNEVSPQRGALSDAPKADSEREPGTTNDGENHAE